MAVLPGAIIGELLERLNAERRRVVLDGFEPHPGEWQRAWTGRRATGRRQPEVLDAADVEVLDRIARDLEAAEPGQPTAAEIVLMLTSAVRRAPDRAAVIVDAMLTDHPRMAVVIVATALRVAPALRRDILATARQHKPFSRHPFILAILLAVVAKLLSDHGAEAAQPFEGAETPHEVLAAAARHYAAHRPSTEGRTHGGDRTAGFGPLGTPAMVATVLVAGEAMSRALPPEAAPVPHAGHEPRPGPDAAPPAGGGVDQLDGGEAGDRLSSSVARDRQSGSGEAAQEPAPPATPASADAPQDAEPRSMAALAPVAEGARDHAAAAAPADEGAEPHEAAATPAAAAPQEVESSTHAAQSDPPPQRLVEMPAAPDQPADAVPHDSVLGPDAPSDAAPPTAETAEAGLPGDAGPSGTPPQAFTGTTETVAEIADSLPDPGETATTGLDGSAPSGELDLDPTATVAVSDEGPFAHAAVDLDASAGTAVDLDTTIGLDLFGDGGVADVGVTVDLDGTAEVEAASTIGLLDGAVAKVDAGIDASVPGVAEAKGTVDVELLGDDGAADIDVAATASMGEAASVDSKVAASLLQDDRVAAVDADIDASAAGVAEAGVAAEVALGGEGASVDIAGGIAVDDLLSVEVGLSSDDGIDIAIDLLPPRTDPVPLVDDVVDVVPDVVDATLGSLLGSPPPEEDDPPMPTQPVHSVLDTLGGLFG
jgi:hypothetical protein